MKYIHIYHPTIIPNIFPNLTFITQEKCDEKREQKTFFSSKAIIWLSLFFYYHLIINYKHIVK